MDKICQALQKLFVDGPWIVTKKFVKKSYNPTSYIYQNFLINLQYCRIVIKQILWFAGAIWFSYHY